MSPLRTFAFALILLVFATSRGVAAPEFNVRDFGAVGNGLALDTKALQSAIDACSAKQGGTVRVPAGNYAIGTIRFPGEGTAEDAKRVVPEDIARYPEQFFFGVLPSWGLYLRHVNGVAFKNVRFENRSADQRPPVVLDDVLHYHPSSLPINGEKIK